MKLKVRACAPGVLLVLVLFFGSCGDDDCPVNDTYYYVDRRAKEIFPYSGEDTLHFLHILGDDTTELELFGQGRKHGFNSRAEISNCDTPKEVFHEYIRYIYETLDKSSYVELQITEQNPDPRAAQAIIFESKHISTHITYSAVESDTLLSSGYHRLEQQEFNDVSYRDIIRVEYPLKSITEFTENVVLHYHKDFGFVRIKNRTTGEIYQLK